MRAIEMSGLMVMPKSMENDPSSVGWLSDRVKPIDQEEVDQKAYQEAHEPRVVVEHRERRNQQAAKGHSARSRGGRVGRPIEPARIFVAAFPPIKVLDNEKLLAEDEVVANEHARDGAEKTGVANQPAENVAPVVRHQFPGLHDDAHGAGDQAAGAETDAARRKIREIVGGGNHVGSDVDVKSGYEQSNHGQDHRPGIAEARENRNRIPEGLAKNNHGGGSYRDADKGVEGHRCGEAEGLADDLIALAAGVTREIRNVQRHRGPESDHAGERRNEETEELSEALKFRGLPEHGAEAARFRACPQEKGKSDEQQERCGNALQKANGFNAAQNHQHIQKPEKEKAECRARMKIRPAGSQGHDHGVDGLAADPGLNAEPAARQQGAQN